MTRERLIARLRPRKHDRVNHLGDVTYRVVPGSRALRGNTIDLSPSGVKIFTRNALQTGDPIDLTWTEPQPPLTVGGYVVYVKVMDEGSWAGVVFHHPLSPEDFQRIRAQSARRLTS